MDEALELEDIDAAYCLLFLREVRDAEIGRAHV